jgi:transposase
LETCVRGLGAGCGQRIRHDRRHHRSGPPAQRRRKRGDPDKQALGRSRGGLSTKIHATVDALGNPTGFLVTPGQAHDLEGADALLKNTLAQTVIADKAYDAQVRLIEPLLAKGKAVVIPSRVTNKQPREYDRDLYKARHLIENFFARLKQYRAIATRYDKTARNFLGAIHLAASMVWLA